MSKEKEARKIKRRRRSMNSKQWVITRSTGNWRSNAWKEEEVKGQPGNETNQAKKK